MRAPNGCVILGCFSKGEYSLLLGGKGDDLHLQTSILTSSSPHSFAQQLSNRKFETLHTARVLVQNDDALPSSLRHQQGGIDALKLDGLLRAVFAPNVQLSAEMAHNLARTLVVLVVDQDRRPDILQFANEMAVRPGLTLDLKVVLLHLLQCLYTEHGLWRTPQETLRLSLLSAPRRLDDLGTLSEYLGGVQQQQQAGVVPKPQSSFQIQFEGDLLTDQQLMELELDAETAATFFAPPAVTTAVTPLERNKEENLAALAAAAAAAAAAASETLFLSDPFNPLNPFNTLFLPHSPPHTPHTHPGCPTSYPIPQLERPERTFSAPIDVASVPVATKKQMTDEQKKLRDERSRQQAKIGNDVRFRHSKPLRKGSLKRKCQKGMQ